jgi:hypothetical protein
LRQFQKKKIDFGCHIGSDFGKIVRVLLGAILRDLWERFWDYSDYGSNFVSNMCCIVGSHYMSVFVCDNKSVVGSPLQWERFWD